MTVVSTPTLGSDVALTRYRGVASGVQLDEADSWGGLDLAVGPRPTVRSRGPGGEDLGLARERDNLGQALILRLLTPRGGLARLGHAAYGSRLLELIGRPNDASTRDLARLHTIEALAAEPRAALVDLVVDVPPGRSDSLRVAFSVLPVGQTEPLSLSLEVAL